MVRETQTKPPKVLFNTNSLCRPLLLPPLPSLQTACLGAPSGSGSPPLELLLVQTFLIPLYSHSPRIPPGLAPAAGHQASFGSTDSIGYPGSANRPYRSPSSPWWVPLWLPTSCQRCRPKKIISSPGWGRVHPSLLPLLSQPPWLATLFIILKEEFGLLARRWGVTARRLAWLWQAVLTM